MTTEIEARNRIKIPKYTRGSGDATCKVCAKAYRSHSFDLENVDWDGFPYLRKLCDGTLVKINYE